jgi:two-component system CheB/CheR fusion protein
MPHQDEPAETASIPAIPETSLPQVPMGAPEQETSDAADTIIPSYEDRPLPMVGIGGSAGAIPALKIFFESMPPDPGLAFVVVLHLSPSHESNLSEMIQRWTPMPVFQARDGIEVSANNVYVIPPGQKLASTDGQLRLAPLDPEKGRHVAVDLFFRSLADSHGPNGSAIVLSGADGDGSIGIKRIKEYGGLTIAQDPEEAEQRGMPQSAINTGMVDLILRVAQMPQRLIDYTKRRGQLHLPSEDGPQPAQSPVISKDENESVLREILSYLRTRTGRDFSYYKRATIVRRISRRMQVNCVNDLQAYLSALRTNPREAQALLQDLLISVTNFFRDRDAFDALNALVPALFTGKSAGDTVRVWVPACASGEEAYSLAMLLLERAGSLESPPKIQIFGCDLDDSAIQVARTGLYPETIEADLSEERLQRFFHKEDRAYRIRRELREMVLFAAHDLLKDAPFARMDLISCRNLLIYLNRDAQNRAFEIFHFSLKPSGLLFLGSSETVDEQSPLFDVLDKKHRIYRRRNSVRMGLPVPHGPGTLARAVEIQEANRTGLVLPPRSIAQVTGSSAGAVLSKSVDTISPPELHFRLIEQFAPPSVIINADHEIVHLSQNAGKFLQWAGGHPTANLLRVIHPMLRVELRSALFHAAESGSTVELRQLRFEVEGVPRAVNIKVSPARELAPGFLLVVFEPVEVENAASTESRIAPEPVIGQLERELEQMKTRLRDTVEQYEASNEELKASNEELQAMNEELRSASEELETSREELQSMNEEISTVNQELKSKLDELGHANSDLRNLMASTAIPTVFLDRHLRIMRFTPAAVDLFRLIASDVGRPLGDLRHRLDYPDLGAEAQRVLEHLVPVQREVRAESEWYLARLLPYRTLDDHIAGVVLTFVNITESKQAAEALRASEERFRQLLESASEFAIFTLGMDHRVTNWSSGAKAIFGYGRAEILGRSGTILFTPEDRENRIPEKETETAGSEGRAHNERWHIRKDGSRFYGSGVTQPLRDSKGVTIGFVKILRDLTERVKASEALRESEQRYSNLLNAMDEAFVVQEAIVDEKGQITDWRYVQCNPAFERQTGISNAFGKTVRELIPEIEPSWMEKYEQVWRSGVSSRFQERMAGLDRWLDVFASRIGGAESRKIALLFSDITGRRRAEEALRRSQEELRLIVDNATEFAIFSMDLERRITTWNRGARFIFGYRPEEIAGQSGDIIFGEEDRAAGAPEREAAIAIEQGRANDERWHVKKDGSRFWSSGAMMPMRNAEGVAVGLIKVLRDHTAELHAREALARSREKLEDALVGAEKARHEASAANAAKDQFLARLSHELRTPLMPVLITAEALLKQAGLPERVRKGLEMISRNVELETHFINDLLDLTRISKGKFDLAQEPVDLHRAIEAAFEICEPEFKARDQKLSLRLHAKNPVVLGDFTRLQQVFWNLLQNASKFTPQAGLIQISTDNDGNRVLAKISDSGIGIDPTQLKGIFEAFRQGDASISRTYGGLGLGLAISKATIEQLGGAIEAESRGPGKGSIFTIILPATDHSADASKA